MRGVIDASATSFVEIGRNDEVYESEKKSGKKDARDKYESDALQRVKQDIGEDDSRYGS